MRHFRLLTLSIFLWTLSLGNAARAGQIVNPWRATTAIVKGGESFEVWFNGDSEQTVNSVTLRGPYNTVAASMEFATGDWTYDPYSGNKYNTLITVTVPSSAPADRYDLVLNTSTGQEVSPRGVKVIKKLKETYYILHISDHHLFQGGYNNESLERNSLIVDLANVIDPEMVFITGDNVYGCSADEYGRRVGVFYQGEDSPNRKGMNAFDAAVFVTPGNHDLIACSGFDLAQASDWWNDFHGLQLHHFTYGQGRFMVINDTWGGHYRQQIDQLSSWFEQVGPGNLAIAAGHGRGQMADLDDAVPLTAAFAGHNHGDCTLNPNLVGDRNFVYVACALRRDSSFRFNLFRVDSNSGAFTAMGVKNTKEGTGAFGLPTGYYEALENPGDKDQPTAWKPNLRLTYERDNNGSSTANTATLVNKLDADFPEARIRFVMAKGHHYAVSPGTITQQFDGDGVRVVDVRARLDAESTISVSIEAEHEIDTASDADSDTDSDADSDVDSDTDSDADSDADFDTENDAGSSSGKSSGSGSCGFVSMSPNGGGNGILLLIVLSFFGLGRHFVRRQGRY